MCVKNKTDIHSLKITSVDDVIKHFWMKSKSP